MIAIGDRRPFRRAISEPKLSAPRNILASAPLKEIDGDIHHPLMSYGFAEHVTLGDGVKQATSFPSQRRVLPGGATSAPVWREDGDLHRFKAEGPR